MVLRDVDTLAVCSLYDRGLDDVQLVMADTMPGSHLGVHLLHSTVQGEVAVLLVHVVVTCTRLVANPHTVVLGGSGLLLEDLHSTVDTSYKAVCLLKRMKVPSYSIIASDDLTAHYSAVICIGFSLLLQVASCVPQLIVSGRNVCCSPPLTSGSRYVRSSKQVNEHHFVQFTSVGYCVCQAAQLSWVNQQQGVPH